MEKTNIVSVKYEDRYMPKHLVEKHILILQQFH